MKHVFTAGICANEKQPGGPTKTENGRPALLGWLMASDWNVLDSSIRHSFMGMVLRSNEKQPLRQFAAEQRRSVAGKVAFTASMRTPLSEGEVMCGSATALSRSRTGKWAAGAMAAPASFTLAASEESGVVCASWESAATVTATMAKYIALIVVCGVVGV